MSQKNAAVPPRFLQPAPAAAARMCGTYRDGVVLALILLVAGKGGSPTFGRTGVVFDEVVVERMNI